MSKITAINILPTSSGLYHYAQAALDCGHVHGVKLVQHRGVCVNCNDHEVALTVGGNTCDKCGRQVFTVTFVPSCEREEDRLTKVGDEVACDTCPANLAALNRLEEMDLTDIVYFRFDTRFGGRYNAYRRDTTSPTGVMLADSFPATPEIDAVIDRRHIRAISPTEGRS